LLAKLVPTFLRIEDVTWSAQRIPAAVNLSFHDRNGVDAFPERQKMTRVKYKSLIYYWNRNISVDIATGHGLDGWVSIPGKAKRFLFSTPQRPDRFCSPPSLFIVQSPPISRHYLHLSLFSNHLKPCSSLNVTDQFTPPTSQHCRSQWPRGLRHEQSSLARTLGSWV
jgi:hypothetical protein